MVAGIPTTYRYNAMRSRLEARWAAFFDLIRWPWTYEPLDADGYIPDFLIHGDYPLFVEVGPCITQSDYEKKAAKAEPSVATLGHDLLIVGVTPLPTLATSWEDAATGGWLGQFFPDISEVETGGIRQEASWDFGPAMWTQGCHPGHLLSVFHDFQSYACRPCGYYEGGHHPGRVARNEIEDLWAQAGSRVQWKP